MPERQGRTCYRHLVDQWCPNGVCPLCGSTGDEKTLPFRVSEARITEDTIRISAAGAPGSGEPSLLDVAREAIERYGKDDALVPVPEALEVLSMHNPFLTDAPYEPFPLGYCFNHLFPHVRKTSCFRWRETRDKVHIRRDDDGRFLQFDVEVSGGGDTTGDPPTQKPPTASDIMRWREGFDRQMEDAVRRLHGYVSAGLLPMIQRLPSPPEKITAVCGSALAGALASVSKTVREQQLAAFSVTIARSHALEPWQLMIGGSLYEVDPNDLETITLLLGPNRYLKLACAIIECLAPPKPVQ